MWPAFSRLSWVHPFFVALILSGCANIRLYSEARDKQGTEAKSAWAQVDLNSVFKSEREALDKLLEQELDTQERVSMAIREQQMTAILRAPTIKEGAVDRINARLSKLVGTQAKATGQPEPLLAFKASREARSNLADRARERQLEEVNFLPLREEMPGCQEVESGDASKRLAPKMNLLSPANRDDVERSLGRLKKNCSDERSIRNSMDSGLGGLLAQVIRQYKADVASLEASKAAFLKERAEYAQALDAYRKAVQEEELGKSARSRVVEAAKNLGKKLKQLEKLQNAYSKELVSKERLAVLGGALSEIASSEAGKAPEGASRPTVALVLLPHLFDEGQKLFQLDRRPQVAALLMRRNFEQLQLEAASRDVKSREDVVHLSKSIVDTTYEQAERVYLASVDMEQIPTSEQVKSIREVLGQSKPEVKAAVYRSLAYYLDSIGRLSAKRYQLEYRRIAAMHDRALGYSEVNVQQWASLIGFGVEEVATSSAGGIKGSMIGEALNTFGILGIGYGVNR